MLAPVIVAGIIAAAGAVGSAVIAGQAAGDAADTMAGGQQAAARITAQSLEAEREAIQKAVDLGLVDMDTGYNIASKQLQTMIDERPLNQYRSLLDDPSSVMDDPGVKFQQEQGIEALQAAFSRTGGGGLSGSGVKAAEEFGQGLASTSLNQALARLMPLISRSDTAKTNVANLATNQGNAKANLRAGAAAKTANLTGQMAPAVAGFTAGAANAQAGGQVGGANAAIGLLQNLANTGVEMAPELASLFTSSQPLTTTGSTFNPNMLAR